MKKVIFIGGYCATGKSSFARALSDRFYLPLFCKDTLKENLADSIGGEQQVVIQSLSVTVFKLMLFLAETQMQAGKPFIMESNFKPREADAFRVLAAQYDYESLTYIFTGDLDALYQRYAGREQDGLRHWCHQGAGELRETFVAGNEPLGDIDMGGKILRADMTDFNRVDFAALHQRAAEFMQ